jgi:hypothetical protein
MRRIKGCISEYFIFYLSNEDFVKLFKSLRRCSIAIVEAGGIDRGKLG